MVHGACSQEIALKRSVGIRCRCRDRCRNRHSLRFLSDPVLVFSELRDHRDNSVLSLAHDYDHDNDNAPDVFSTPKNLIARRSEAVLVSEYPS